MSTHAATTDNGTDDEQTDDQLTADESARIADRAPYASRQWWSA